MLYTIYNIITLRQRLAGHNVILQHDYKVVDFYCPVVKYILFIVFAVIAFIQYI